MSESKFYVYLHRAADTGDIFYVGKGYGDRDRSKSGRSKWWKNVVTKHGYTIERFSENLTEKEAFDLEIELIAKYGRRLEGGLLVNLSIGGDGPSGFKQSKESVEKKKASRRAVIELTDYCQRISESMKKRWDNPDYRHSQIEAQNSNRPPKKIRRKTKDSEELRGVMSANAKALWERPGWRENQVKTHQGKVRSDEAKAKFSKAMTGRKRDPSHVEKTAAGNRGKTRTEESKQLMAEKKRLAWADPSYKEMMLLARKQAAERRAA